VRVGAEDVAPLGKVQPEKLTGSVMFARANPNADIDGNGAAGLSDLIMLAQHYGQHSP
jgi:hypothetical protein